MPLPHLILIADRFSDLDVAAKVVTLAEAGAPWVMLRDRDADPAKFFEAASALVERLRSLEAPPLISITARMTVAQELDTHLHLGKEDVPRAEARRHLPASALIGYSAHSVAEVAAEAGPETGGAAEGADYLFFSPIFHTDSHPDRLPVGLDALAESVRAARGRPIFALGGITPSRAAACRQAGAHGAAVVSGLMDSSDPAGALAAYLASVGSSMIDDR